MEWAASQGPVRRKRLLAEMHRLSAPGSEQGISVDDRSPSTIGMAGVDLRIERNRWTPAGCYQLRSTKATR
jgi:hypothetical protein